MKKFSAKMLCGVMAWNLAVSPIFACTAAPKADVSKPAPHQNNAAYCACIVASAERAPDQKSQETEADGTRAKSGTSKPTSKPECNKPVVPTKPECNKPVVPTKPECNKPVAPTKPHVNKPAQNKPNTGNESTQNTFVIDNFKVIQGALQKLGVQPEELEGMIKEGKKLPEVLELKNIPVAKFKKALLKQYYAAIQEGVENKQITKEEAKMLRAAIKEKVMSWLQTK